MPARQLRSLDGVPDALADGVARLRRELEVPESFSADALAEAERAASDHRWPDRDATDIPLLTIDPEGSTDLDQALFLQRTASGYRVVYAIADVATFVEPGGAIDAEAHARGVTLYAPDGRTPLHPPVLSEGAASLLPDQERPALLWEHELDASGEVVTSTVERARVRSREQLTYAGVQEALDDGSAGEVLRLLEEVGRLRETLERERGGVSLPTAEQEVTAEGEEWRLAFRSPLPVEGWNAQISLLTGMAAAELMLAAEVGVLRTLPPAEQSGVDRLRRIAKALRIRWPGSMGYGDFVRSLDAGVPAHAAMLDACASLFRGADYVAFHGEVPEQPLHGAMNAAYAHCTAPLRRLVDRYVNEICVSLSAGREVPAWVLEALEGLPDAMKEATSRSNQYERGLLDLVEALVLSPHVGESFPVTVIEWNPSRDRGEVQLAEPAVQAPLVGDGVRLGTEIDAELAEADVEAGKVLFRA